MSTELTPNDPRQGIKENNLLLYSFLLIPYTIYVYACYAATSKFASEKNLVDLNSTTTPIYSLFYFAHFSFRLSYILTR